MPIDVLQRIISFLPLPDLHHLRLSGIGSLDIDIDNFLLSLQSHAIQLVSRVLNIMSPSDIHDTFIDILHPVFYKTTIPIQYRLDIRLRTPKAFRCLLRYVRFSNTSQHCDEVALKNLLYGQFPLPPVQALRKMEKLSLPSIPRDIAATIALEFQNISKLFVVAKFRMMKEQMLLAIIKSPEMSSESLFRIGMLYNLKELYLCGQNIVEIPDMVFCCLNNLLVLDISNNPQLKKLPETMSECLPKLRGLGLVNVHLIRFPQSLADRLIINYNNTGMIHSDDSSFCSGIVVGDFNEAKMWDVVLRPELGEVTMALEKYKEQPTDRWWLDTFVQISSSGMLPMDLSITFSDTPIVREHGEMEM